MGKIVVDNEYAHANWYFMLNPTKVVLVTSVSKEGRTNVMTVGWVMPCSHQPWMVAVAIHPRRYTHQLIEETKEFTVNVPSEELTYQTEYCGEYSGRFVDKFAETRLTAKPGKKVKSPWIKECVAFMECRLAGRNKAGDHTIFIGEIVYAEAEERFIKRNPKTRTIPDRYFDPKKCRTLLHLGGDAYVVSSPKLYKPEVPPPARSWKKEQLKEGDSNVSRAQRI
jgi:flavin reductase (DIM6/NTAB) family NADH-FMN oxidoreductase RutF